uniref:DNA helicase n=1 Tax=Panagrolaimus sp. ES5 TaxID=591445 RepID=A0AC34GNT6_9BILA
ISQWGHDFRPDYARLNVFIENFINPRVPIVACTATATPTIVTDVRSHLGITNSKLFMSSFVRDNLKYEVVQKSHYSLTRLVKALKEKYHESSGIVYCLSQKDTEAVAEIFRKEGFSCKAYHAGLNDTERSTVQSDWMEGNVSVICATIAFGMGIDKPDVRFVVHHSMPNSIEGYYQETGRAGRDGRASYCVLLYSYQDHIRHRVLKEANGKFCHAELGKQHKKSLYEMVEYCENYQLYEVTADARIIINGVRAINNPTILYVAELYRGALSKKYQEKANKANHINLPFFGLGNSLNEADAIRLIRKLVTEGYLDEFLIAGPHGNHYGVVNPSQKGSIFANQDDSSEIAFGQNVQKVFIHFSTEKRKSSTGSAANVQFSMTTATKATETDALKDKYRFKHKDIFVKCKAKLVQFFTTQAREENFSSYTAIIGLKGLEELAALMPRTNSELLQIDSMTPDKVAKYSEKIMGILKEFWAEVDKREHDEIKKQLKSLNTAASVTQSPSSSNNFNFDNDDAEMSSPSYGRPSYGRRGSYGGGRGNSNGGGGAVNQFKTAAGKKAFNSAKNKFARGGTAAAKRGGTTKSMPFNSAKNKFARGGAAAAKRGGTTKSTRGKSNKSNPFMFPPDP